ncbi:DUF6428 family protein [Planctomicrobium sp. SH527]|uniref:DUF6428 family protein n=1 Tax=Planctomicrobium sp. SH527 TaxID=3448123 RepID=UPI003F5C0867
MTLSDLIAILSATPDAPVHCVLPDASFVPAHFHITEIGRVRKDFVDCGGTVRHSENCTLQVWVANDLEHRLGSSKLFKIINKGLSLFSTTTLPLEVEYDNGVISQYPVLQVEVKDSGIVLQLGTKHTACLAPDLCGVDLNSDTSCCPPGCC